ncbi:MAG: hypothetical protein RLZZ293_1165, partial [Pseudomonadota bacterium]
SLTTRLFLESDNLQIESGNLIDLEHKINFSGTSFCLSCNKESANVVLKINAEINNLGHLLEELDLGKIIDHGRGEAKSELSWQGGLADFNLLHIHGLIEGHFSSGKFLKVNPGILGGLMSIINLQGLFELSFGDINDIFKTGFFFTDLDFKTEVNYSEVILKHLYLSGPMAVVTSNGKANFADNSLDAYLSVSPKLGIAVALTAGVATLNPFIGLAVYLGELASGQMQNKLFAFGYHVAGNLKHPQVTKVEVSKQFIRNIHNLVGSEK